MLISKNIQDAINQQVAHEFGAMLQYLCIASYLQGEVLPLLSANFFEQAEEEKEHAMMFIKYLNDTGATVVIPDVKKPQSSFKSVEEAVKLSLDQEVIVTKQINDLVAIAKKEDDYISENFLQYFVDEQLEEISSMQDLLTIVKRAGNDLLAVEQYLARSAKMAPNEAK